METHPRWTSNGYIVGQYPTMRVPSNSQLRVEVGFLKGATGSDGATFEVWFVDESQRKHLILSRRARYDGRLDQIVKDLNFLAGKRGRFSLYVNAGPSSAQDWAVWAVARIETAPLRRVEYEGISPSWSPDGSQIAFSKREDGSRFYRIYIASVATGESRVATKIPPPSGTSEMRPSWSPDGTKIVYEHMKVIEVDHAGNDYSLWTLDVESGTAQLLLEVGRLAPGIPTPPGFPDEYGYGWATSPSPFWTRTYAGSIRIVASDPLDPAVVNKRYSYRFDIIGGAPPYTLEIGGLPAGISYIYTEGRGGWLRGIPTRAGVYAVKFSVKDSKGLTAQKTCKLVVYSETARIGMRWPWPGDEYFVLATVEKPFEFNVTTTLYGGVPPYTIEFTELPEWAKALGGKIFGKPGKGQGGAYTVGFAVTDSIGARNTFVFEIFVLYPIYRHITVLDAYSMPRSPPYSAEWVAYVSDAELLGDLGAPEPEYITSPLAYLKGVGGFGYSWIKEERYKNLEIREMYLEVVRGGETLRIEDKPTVRRWGDHEVLLSGFKPVDRDTIFIDSDPPLQRVSGQLALAIRTRGGQTATLRDTIYVYRSAYRAVHGFSFPNFGTPPEPPDTPYLYPSWARSYFGDDDFCVEEQISEWLFPGIRELIEIFTDCAPDPIAMLFLEHLYKGAAKGGNCYGMSLLSLRAREGNLDYSHRSRSDESWSRPYFMRAWELPLEQFKDPLLEYYGSSAPRDDIGVGGVATGDSYDTINILQGANLEMDHLVHGIDKIILGGRFNPLAPAVGAAAYNKPSWLVHLWTKNLYNDIKANLRKRGAHRDVEGFEESTRYAPMIVIMINSFEEAHAVVAYDMVDVGDRAYILIYDPDQPFDPSDPDDGKLSYILIDKSKDWEWTWSFPYFGWSGGYIWAEPYSLVGREAEPNFPSIDDLPEFLSRIPQGLGVLIAWLNDIIAGSAHVDQVTNGEGLSLYTEDGRINLDPRTSVTGMVFLPAGKGRHARKVYILVRNDSYNFEVKGDKRGAYYLGFTQGRLFMLANTTSSEGSRDSLLLDPLDSKFTFIPLTEDKPVGIFVDRFYGRKRLREIYIELSSVFQGRGVSVTTEDDNSVITLRNLGPASRLKIVLRRATPSEFQEVVYDNLRIGEGETWNVKPQWEDLLKEAGVDVDSDSDGKWDISTVLEKEPPKIKKIALTPEAPGWGDEVTVSALITDEGSGIRKIVLCYSTDGGKSWAQEEMRLVEDGKYEGRVPGQMVGVEVVYYIKALDNSGNTAVSAKQSYKVGISLWVMGAVVALIALVVIVLVVLRRRRK